MSPKFDTINEIFQGQFDFSKMQTIDALKASKRTTHSVDFEFENPQKGKSKLVVSKRLKAKDHMISFKEIKASEFTQAKLKMRNVKEERERLLGQQFTD